MDQGDDMQGFVFDPNEVIGWDPRRDRGSNLAALPFAIVVNEFQNSPVATAPSRENVDALVSRDVPQWEWLDSFPTGTFAASNHSPLQSTWMQQPDNLLAFNNDGSVWPAYREPGGNNFDPSPAFSLASPDPVPTWDSTISSPLLSTWIQQPATIPTFSNEGSVWPLNHELEGSNLNASSLSHALTLPLDGSYPSWVSNTMDYPDAMNPENFLEQSSFIESIDPLPYFSGDITPSSSTTTPELAPIHAKIASLKKGRSEKPKIVCPVRGCNKSFKRPYELKRHGDTMHNPKVRIYCFVYGCNHLETPFPRKDKFREHWRKHHQSAGIFVCIGKDCQAGQFDLAGLVAHLNAAHTTSTSLKPNVRESLNEASIDPVILGGADKGSHLFHFQRLHSCPLAFLGCNFRYDNPAPYAAEVHIECHPLQDRSRGFMALRGADFHWAWGRAHCPICDSEICNQNMKVDIFLQHIVDEHSREERLLHKTQLKDLLCPTTEFRTELQSWTNSWDGRRSVARVATLLAEFSESSD